MIEQIDKKIFNTDTDPLDHVSLRKNCPCSEFFLSTFSRIRTKSGEIRSTFPYSVRMRQNTNQKNSKNEHPSRSECFIFISLKNIRETLVSGVFSG